MAKMVDKFMDFMKLSYDDDDYDDNYDRQPEKEKPRKAEKPEKAENAGLFGGRKKETASRETASKEASAREKVAKVTRIEPEQSAKTDKKETKKTFTPERRTETAAPQRAPHVSVVRGGGNRMESAIVSIRPKDDSSKIEIADRLLEGKTVLINMEGLEVDAMQRIVDFTAGVCYAIRGDMRFPSKYSIIAAPEDVELSGKYEDSQDKNSGHTFG